MCKENDWPIAIVTLWSLDAYCDDTKSIMTTKQYNIYTVFSSKIEHPRQKIIIIIFQELQLTLFPLISTSYLPWPQ
jgi:hypothetical protein